MSRRLYRRTDPLNATYNKTSRMIRTDTGYFYKVRGGTFNGPFETLEEAEADLLTFMAVLKIENEMDMFDFRISA